MTVSPSDDSVSSDGSVFSDCSVSVMMVFLIDGSVCVVEECYKYLQYLFQCGTLQDMINGY